MATETYELRVQGVVKQERNECVMHFQSDNVTANDTLVNGQSLIDSWTTNVMAAFLACLPSSYYLDRLAARRVTKPSAVAHLQYELEQNVGTSSSNTASSDQICPSIFLIPPMGTKSGGKIFMPVAGNLDFVDNQVQAGYITAIATFMGLQVVNFGVSGVHWQQVVYSRKLAIASHVLAWNVSPRIGFQNRRRAPI